MNQVRVHGDPFGDDVPASLLRSYVRLALGSGMRCALSLAAVQPREPLAGEREVPLTDGVRNLRVGTRLPPAEIELLLRAAGESVAATAPVLVFATAAARADAVRTAALSWPKAATVLAVRDGVTAPELLERLRAELRWSGCEHPPHALDERELAPWLALPARPEGGVLVGVGSGDFASGLDLLVTVWRQRFAGQGPRLRLVLQNADASVVQSLRERLGEHAAAAELIVSPFELAHARDAVAIVLPYRRFASSRELVQALASGRPVCVSRFQATASLLASPGICLPIGGRNVADEAVEPAHFAPHPAALLAAIKQALGDDAQAGAQGHRARIHVIGELTRARPTTPPPPIVSVRSSRPTVVLQAPFFETSSSAELSLATAASLHRRGRVELRLVTDGPFRSDLATLRARAPELEPLLVRDPGTVDLWLSSGWPVRADRPACRSWALRIDQEYGSLPLDLTPHVTQDADAVVVHSEHVYRTLTAAGRPMHSMKVIPHGVDAAMHEQAVPDPAIVAWKQGRPAVLFCGGLIWRKGFDVWLRAVLAAWQQSPDFCLVVKTVGHDAHYGRFHLGELLERVRNTPGAPPVYVVDRELTRAELASVYTACDLLLHPYRGEGFCLPVLEARACGLPVLATAGGATEALMVGPGAVRVPAGRREVELPQAHIGTPWVLEPSGDDCARLLSEALANLPALQRDARGFAKSVRAAYTWDSAAAAIEELAFAAMGKRRVPLPEPVVTLEPVSARGEVIVPVPVRS